MDTELANFIHATTPKMNLEVTRGLACRQVADAMAYVERIWRCAEPGFPEGLRYHGTFRCTPKEVFDFATAKKNNRQTFEFTKSDIYLVKHKLSWQGEPLKDQYTYLPFVSEAGLISIMGSMFSISPVLADKAVSVGEDSIFIPLNRDKLTFRRTQHHFLIDGVRHQGSVVWSNIHHASKKSNGPMSARRTMNANAAMVHYLFCKYGLTRTFQQFTNTHVVAGYPEDITPEKYPSDKWIIFSSFHQQHGKAPTGIREKFYSGTKVRLAVKRQDFTESVEHLVSGFWYVADRFPDRMNPEYFDDVRFWKPLLGHVIYANDDNEGRLLNKVDQHMASLDGYIDGMVRNNLAEDGIFVHDLYDLFMHIIETYSSRITGNASSAASMYDKRLMILRYVLIDIIKAIFGLMFALQGNTKKAITKADVLNAMQRFLKPLLIIKINHKHGEVSSVNSPSDCMAFKVTSNMVLQTNIGNGGGNAKSIIIDSSRILHASIAEVGQMNNLPKGEPTGRTRINPYVILDKECSIVRNPELEAIIEKTQAAIQR